MKGLEEDREPKKLEPLGERPVLTGCRDRGGTEDCESWARNVPLAPVAFASA
jgi:hypothetical protein